MAETSIGERVAIVREVLGLSSKDFAAEFGMTQGGISHIETGKVHPSYEMLSIISSKWGFSADWLLTGKGEMLDNQLDNTSQSSTGLISIPYFDHMAVGAGIGLEVLYEEPDGVYQVSRSLLRVARGDLKCIKVTGYSMTPRINEGDYVIVDITEQTIRQEGIYVVCVDNALLVKYLQWIPNGLILISANKEYKPIELTDDNYNMDYGLCEDNRQSCRHFCKSVKSTFR